VPGGEGTTAFGSTGLAIEGAGAGRGAMYRYDRLALRRGGRRGGSAVAFANARHCVDTIRLRAAASR